MPFIAPELIIQAKQMDLLTYLKNYEPYELVKFSGNTYCIRNPRQFEDFKREMDMVVERYRWQECIGLSD